MTQITFTKVEFEDTHPCVSWLGEGLLEGEGLARFLSGVVKSRLDDQQGDAAFHEHLRGLDLTGMGKESLEKVLNAEVSEERSWAGGEALAEAYLAEARDIIFPWNTERDKRNPFASLPGADLVGFERDGTGYKFALGEVKTSSEEKFPPQVMSGRSEHMGGQILKLANNLRSVCQLIKWLLPRVRGTDHQEAFDSSCRGYFNSNNKSVALFGVLVRDTSPNLRDLSGRGTALRTELCPPTSCDLIALYLPWKMDQLVRHIREGGAR